MSLCNRLKQLFIMVIVIGLAACSTQYFNKLQNGADQIDSLLANAHPEQNGGTVAARSELAAGADIGGSVSASMDINDKKKMFRALDKPLGKTTQWTNQNTGVTYEVVATEKVTINGNSFCRKYHSSARKNNNEQQTNGTACVGTDSNWQEVN
jgi:surface antigen